jgi:Glycosyltransferase family 87
MASSRGLDAAVSADSPKDAVRVGRTTTYYYVVLTILGHALILCVIALAHSVFHVQYIGDVETYFKEMSTHLLTANRTLGYSVFTLPIILLPRLLTARESAFVTVFAVEMLFFDALIVYLVALRAATVMGLRAVPVQLAWYTAFTLTLSPLLFTRFDLVPTALAFAATLTWFSRRPILAGAEAAVGALLKVFPGCVVPVAFLWEARHRQGPRFRGTLAALVTLSIGVMISWSLGDKESFGYQLERGLHFESVPAGFLMLLGKVAGMPMKVVWSHATLSNVLEMRGSHLVTSLTVPMQGIALLIVCWRFWRSRMSDPLRYVTAAILALLVPAKVLSPQYLIWLTPFFSVLEGRTGCWGRWILLPCCVATVVISPFRYVNLAALDTLTIGILNLRNMLMVSLLLLLIFGRENNGARVDNTVAS